MKKNFFMLILIFFVLLIINPSITNAGGSGSPGQSGSMTSCKSGLCYSVRVGMRVSIVYGVPENDPTKGNPSQNGVRCNYDASNNTLCSEFGSGNGTPSKSIDIWFSHDPLPWMGNIKTVASNKKLTKQEFVARMGSLDYGPGSTYYNNDSYLLRDISTLSFLGRGDANDIKRKNGESSARHVTNFTDDILYAILELDEFNQVKTSKKWGSYNGQHAGKLSAIPILNQLVGLMTNGQIDFEKMSSQSRPYSYIQFDQLIQYGYYTNGEPTWRDSVIGTVAEVANYWKNKTQVTTGSWCISNNNEDLKVNYEHWCGVNGMVESGFANGWYSAGGSSKSPGGATVLSKALGLSYASGASTGDRFSALYANDTRNVAYYWLDNGFSGSCESDEDLLKLLQTGIATPDLKTMIDKFELKYVGDPMVKIKYQGLNSENKLSRMNEFIISMFGLPQERDEACFETLDCDTAAYNIYQCYSRGKNTGKNGMELGKNCSSNSSKYEGYLRQLADIYGIDYETSLLNKAIYQSVGKTRPSCGTSTKTPDCKASIPSISCGNKFTFKDASDRKKCWGIGIAYQTGDGLSATSLEQTTDHSDASCVRHGCSGSHTCSTYCYEEVEFDLPDKPNETKAGQVFKWGEGGKESNIFGTMRVTKKCTSNSKGNDCTYHTACRYHCHRTCSCGKNCRYCCSSRVDYATSPKGFRPDSFSASDWKDDVETEIELIYKEPTDDSIYPSPNPKAVIDSSKTVSSGSYNPPTCRDSDCSNDSIHTMTNEYTFVYPEELDWSSYKVDNSLVSQADNEDYYYHIGYGFPTAFTTPDGSYGPTGNGELTARITKIGARQKKEEGYRFDKLTKDVDIDYSCEFDIDNELYDYECCDETGHLKAGAPSYCDPVCTDDDPGGKRKGIDVVFRTIELMGSSHPDQVKRAFPGRAGTGRSVGSNWYELYANPTELHKVLNSDIYSKDPQYEIKLTISNIQAIRELNESAGVDPYTEMTESSSGTTGFVCVSGSSPDGVYKRCASNFLTHLSGLGSNSLKGKCMNGGNTSGRAAKYKDGGCLQTH